MHIAKKSDNALNAFSLDSMKFLILPQTSVVNKTSLTEVLSTDSKYLNFESEGKNTLKP